MVFLFGSNGLNLISITSNIANSGWNPYAISSIPLTLGVWAHVATTINLNSTLVYINGLQAVNATGGTCVNILRTSCKIGRSDLYPSHKDLNAVLDDLKIVNRVLDQTEIFNEMTGPPLNVSYTNGLTNYWPFSGSTIDVVGGMNLTIKLNGNFVPDRLGNADSALYLNKGYAMAPPAVYFDCAVGFTFMTWIKMISTANFPSILEFSNGLFKDSIIVDIGGLTFYSCTSNIANSDWNPWATSNTPLILGVWAHIATTVNLHTTIVYVNGLETGRANGGVCVNIMRTSCKIGRSDSPAYPDLDAALDDVKIYNRVLNQDEILNEMKFIKP